MFYIGKSESKRGHKSIDYFIRISENELLVLKRLVVNVQRIDKKYDKLKSAHVNLRKALSKITINPK